MNDLVKKYGVIVIFVVAAFAVGRYTVTPKTVVETQIEVVNDVQFKVSVLTVFKERTVTTKVDRVVVTVVAPDGTTTTTETDKSEIVDHSTEASKGQKIEVVEHKEEKLDQKTIVVENRPDWIVGGQIGLTPLLRAEPVTYGLSVDRRILGPFFVGGWINTDLDGGLSVKMEF